MSWAAQPERGAAWLTRVMMWVALRGGGGPLAIVGAAWFLLTARGARAASRDYLGRVLGRPARLRDVARHFHSFALAVLDRVLLLGGRERAFSVQVAGLEAVMDVVAAGRGCILLGAHVGSFEVLRTVARQAPVPVWALMYRHNAGALTRLLDRLAPALRERVLEIGDTASMIRARECVERGEIVGILADRVPGAQAASAMRGLEHRMVTASFLGAVASFPSGPFVLAAMLGAPVLLFRAVRVGPRTYDVRFEPFVEQVVLRRGSRGADLRWVVERYAAAIERSCRAFPYQWFNFFPFWEHGDAEMAEAVPVAGGVGMGSASRAG